MPRNAKKLKSKDTQRFSATWSLRAAATGFRSKKQSKATVQCNASTSENVNGGTTAPLYKHI